MVGGVNDGDHRIDRMDILDHALEAIRTFEPVTPAQVAALLARTAGPGAEGAYELLVNGAGIRVAVIGSDATLHYKPIQIGRDYGGQVEVLGGLDPADVIATALPSGLPDGAKVRTTSDELASVSGGSS